jgi:hypothetical protein
LTYRVRVALACRIARIDRDRFNEAVHAGNYPCAPAVLKGSTRIFDPEDLLSLYIYARLLEEAVAPKNAGELACLIGEQARMHPGEARIHIARAASGTRWILPGSKANDAADQMLGRRNMVEPLISIKIFHIANIRKIIQLEIEEEKTILGEHDEVDK